MDSTKWHANDESDQKPYENAPETAGKRGDQRPVGYMPRPAAIPRNLIITDNKTFRTYVMGTYNIIEAAMKLGILEAIIALSETTYDVCFAEGHKPMNDSRDPEAASDKHARRRLLRLQQMAGDPAKRQNLLATYSRHAGSCPNLKRSLSARTVGGFPPAEPHNPRVRAP